MRAEMVVHAPGTIVTFTRHPIESPPMLRAPEPNQMLQNRTTGAGAASFRPNEEIFKVARRQLAPCVRMDDIVRKAGGFARRPARSHEPEYGRIRSEDPSPRCVGHCVGNTCLVKIAIPPPHLEPRISILRNRWPHDIPVVTQNCQPERSAEGAKSKGQRSMATSRRRFDKLSVTRATTMRSDRTVSAMLRI